MNTPTKRIFYLFGPKIAKNEPQTKVWGSLTCKSQCSRPVARVFALVVRVRRASQPVARVFALVAAVRRSSASAGAHSCYLTPAFFLARSIAAICSSESLMEP